ncbi:GNAT family N-acetyltransferase [Streptoalloteichus hindustanus]|uniref:Protein N-acetyltransferase, RimJ/RimL family n=1 Tax=Streptoalloteichus hindustanus TaxID=2017 RepID=A0A1M4VK64_STRHI|nr:GNAT family N-acetyltransferase [Streptoalloteichus hindustanus]SHE69411.1 Protein N-acetyltransferase, RimJ/RimL family [Streptoalloteichus hindustanus]
MAENPDPWPLRHLVLRTPRLELRPDDDSGLFELAEEARLGVHPPEEMPFAVPWTDAPAETLGREMLQFYWSQRAACRPNDWTVHFLVRLDGRVIGTQGISASDFAVTREVQTGSWLGMRHQGRGYGVEMRAAVLGFAFDHLDALQARSDAFVDNAASLAVSRKLGYVEDGTTRRVRRGRPVVDQRLLLTRERFAEHRPGWTVEVAGLAACRPLLGAVNTNGEHRRSTP